MLVLALIAAACVAAAATAVWRHRRSTQRREALFMFATTRGWEFTFSDDSLTGRWIGTPFDQGERRRATNVIRGALGERPVIAFDYQYDTTTGTGKEQQRTTHRYSVVVLGMPAYLPTLEVTPESVVHRLMSAVGGAADMDLESEDFNRKYRVSAYDPKFASDVLTPRTMHLLISRPSLAFRIQGTDVVSWEQGALAPLDVLSRASTIDDVLTGIPPYIWRDHDASA